MDKKDEYPLERLASIDVARIKSVHAVTIRYGKTFSAGVRDAASLERIAGKIKSQVGKRAPCPTIAALAMELIVKDHPFWDGNHRTAFELGRLICLLFGFRLDVTAEEAVAFMRAIDSQDLPKGRIDKWIEDRLVPMKGR